MPPVAVAVVATGVITAATVGIGAAVSAMAITAALGAASYLLTPKPTAPKIEVRDRKVTIRQPVSPRQVIYGQSMAGGVITYAEVLRKQSGIGKNKHLALVITFAGHECESLEALYLNEVPTVIRREGAPGDSRIPAGYIRQGRFKDFIRMDYRLGTPDQTAYSRLVSLSSKWTSAHRQRGCASIYLELEWDKDDGTFTSGIPNIRAVWKGHNDIYDPRDGQRRWTANPALIEAHYKVTYAGYREDEIDWEAVAAAANVCDEPVPVAPFMDNVTVVGGAVVEPPERSLAQRIAGFIVIAARASLGLWEAVATRRWGGALKFFPTIADALAGTNEITPEEGSHEIEDIREPRYETNGAFDTSVAPSEILPQLLGAMSGSTVYTGGKWITRAGAYAPPEVTLTLEDLRGPVRIASRTSRQEGFNSVHGVFVDPARDSQPTDYPAVQSQVAIAEDNGEEVWQPLDLPFTTSPSMAQRLAKIALLRARQQISVEITVGLRALAVTAGDTVALTLDRYGWTAKPFEVVDWRLDVVDEGALVIALSLREIAPNVYDWDADEESPVDPAPDTDLDNPFALDPPTGLTLASGTEHLFVAGDGIVISRIYATWAGEDDAYAQSYEVRWRRKPADGPPDDWSSAVINGDAESYYIAPVDDGRWYEVQVRAVGNFARSAWASPELGDHLVVGKTAPPSDVTGFAASLQKYGIALRWDEIPDADRAYYEIRHGPDWDNADEIAQIKSDRYLWEIREAGVYPLLIRAFDTSGNMSAGVTAIEAEIPAPPAVVLSAQIVGENIELHWDEVRSAFAVETYEVRYGESFAASALLELTKTTTYIQHVDWGGARRFWVRAVDVAGNAGPVASEQVTITAPGQVAALTAQVIDNNVLFRWDAPSSGTLPVRRYQVRKGPDFATADIIGTVSGTFSTFFEDTAGTYDYWIAAEDTAGNVGAGRKVTATVDQPPDYLLRADDALGWEADRVSQTNTLIQGDAILAPVETDQTWAEHFTSNGWTSPADQIAAGFPIYIQPTPEEAVWYGGLDFGITMPGTRISVTVNETTLAGDPEIVTDIELSEDGSTWDVFEGVGQVFGTNFRYARVRVTVTNAGLGAGLVQINEVRIRLDVKQRTESGNAMADAGDPGGTAVIPTNQFIDIESINITPLSTAPRVAVYDFLDEPYPTEFRVFLFDKDGTRQSGAFSWTVRGY